MQLIKGSVVKRDPGCVANCKVDCKIFRAFVPCCPLLGMFGTADSGITCTQRLQ